MRSQGIVWDATTGTSRASTAGGNELGTGRLQNHRGIPYKKVDGIHVYIDYDFCACMYCTGRLNV